MIVAMVLGLSTATYAAWPFPTPASRPTPACNYYVSTTGSDSNPGSRVQPWRHIQHAITHIANGQAACVGPGAYTGATDNNGQISITNSGAPGARKTLTTQNVSAPPKIRSLWISGSYWTVDHFDISNQSNAYGVQVSGSATEVAITNNYIHELCREGIYTNLGTSSLKIVGNRVWHAQMAGISLSGNNSLLELNEIWGTREMPWLAGGIYAACSDPQPNSCRNDADGVRFFGSGHRIRRNYIHDIPVNHAAGGPIEQQAPHSDCFQTWNNHGQPAGGDTLIEENWCRWPARYLATPADALPWSKLGCSGGNHIAHVENATGTITWKNNVFADTAHGIIVLSGNAEHHFLNNTFDHVQTEAIEIGPREVAGWQIENNIFFDTGDGKDGWLGWRNQSGITIGSNDFFLRSGTPRQGQWWGGGTAPKCLEADPQFMSTGTSTGAGADYRLRNSSPLALTGETIPAVKNDILGTPRIAGKYSYGAFQLVCSVGSSCGPANRAAAGPRDFVEQGYRSQRPRD
jgi:hypothetical protein